MSTEQGEPKGKLVIFGAGNWGTALASIYAPLRPTVLWTRTREQAARLRKERRNSVYMPDHPLPKGLMIDTPDGARLEPEDAVVVTVPSHAVRDAVRTCIRLLNGRLVINAAKGFDRHSLKTMGEVLIELLPESDVVTLSGPNIAREIAAGKPARAVLAGKRLEALSRAVHLLQHDKLTFEISRDRRGVEICASLKGMLAIAIGMADGLSLGDNFTGLLMTYGLREFVTLATFMGAGEATVYGISGLGDMVTSSLSPAGRNRRFGNLLAQGVPVEDALDQVGMVVEGVEMLKTVTRLEELNLQVPLFSTIKRLVFDGVEDPRAALVDTVLKYMTT